MPQNNKIKIRRGLDVDLPLPNTEEGELRYSKDTQKLYIDDGINNVYIGGNTDNFPISTATQTALNGKEPIIPTGTALQYIKGDKTLGTFPTIPMVDQTIINGSTNAVSGNAVFDGLENTISKISKGLISGDSTIAQYLGQNAVASYLVTPKDILEGNVITDISVPGNTIAQQKTAWLALSDKDTYDYIIVQIGLNDVGFTESNATVIARLQDYINTINIGKKATCKVIIGEMIPCRARWDFLFGTTNGAIAQLQWEAINESIRGEGVNAITGINGRVSNHVKMLKDEFGNLAGIYDTGDLIHETNDARSLIASQYRSVLNNFNFLKIAKSTFFDDYLKKGFRSSDTFSLPNSSAGIGFNAVKINNTLRFSENGTAFFINSDNTGRLKFSVSTNVNSSGYSSPVTFSDKLMISSVGVSVNNAQIVGAFNVKQGVDKNISILDGDLDATAVQLNAFNDAGSLNVPMEFKSSKFMFNNGRVLINKTDDDLTNKLQVAGTISASPATTANQVVVKSQLDAVFDGLATKFPTPTGLTTNYLPKWNGTGFGNSLIFENGENQVFLGNASRWASSGEFGICISPGSSTGNNFITSYLDDSTITVGAGISEKTRIEIGATVSTNGSNISLYTGGSLRQRITPSGNTLFGKTNDAGDGRVQVNGNITASPAVSPNQVVVKSQLDAVGRPYKVYTALLTQTGTNAPTVKVLENTLGGTIVFTYGSVGSYMATLSGALFTLDKTFITWGLGGSTAAIRVLRATRINGSDIMLQTWDSSITLQNGIINSDSTFEIRVYN